MRGTDDRRTRDTKERIFSAALDLFSQKGVDAVSIRDIARRVGISAAAFYNHFRSKNELLQAVYDYYRTALVGPAPERAPSIEPFPQGLDAAGVFARYVGRFASAMANPVLAKLGRIISMERHRNKVAAEISFKDRQQLLGFMEELFAAMERQGLLRRGNGRILGRMFGYIQLGLADDNMYYRYVRGMTVDDIVDRQNQAMAEFLRELTGG